MLGALTLMRIDRSARFSDVERDALVVTGDQQAASGVGHYRIAESVLDIAEGFDASDRLHEVTVPALVIHGTEDEVVPVGFPYFGGRAHEHFEHNPGEAVIRRHLPANRLTPPYC